MHCIQVHSLLIDRMVNNTVGPLVSSDIPIGRLVGLLASGWSASAIEAAPQQQPTKICAHFKYEVIESLQM